MVKGIEDRIVDAGIAIVLAVIGVISVFPLLFVVSVSLTPFEEVLKNGGFLVIPREITFEAYAHIMLRADMTRALYVTLFVTVVGTAVNVALTMLMGYPLSRRKLPGRSAVLFLVLFTLLFNGGIIPTYLIVKATGLLNSVWAMIIPNAVAGFNVLIMKTFFENIPEELFESAKIDGAKEHRIAISIVAPLSVPVMLTIGLFYAVGHWNTFFAAVMYISDRSLQPLQVVVRGILMQSQNPMDVSEVTVPTATLQMAAVVFASVPIIIVYPFLQKHFVKGVMIGSVKG